MRYIDTLDLRWHIGEPTWEIIDELLEMIDSAPFEEEIETLAQEMAEGAIRADRNIASRYNEGFNNGYDAGYTDGFRDGYHTRASGEGK